MIAGLAVGVAALVAASGVEAQGQSFNVSLAGQNNSGISGTATFTDIGGGKVRVQIQANGAGSGPEPAHIHQGSCGQLDPTPQFALASLTNGSSSTEVETSLQQLTSSPHAIHLHKSAEEITVYVACADITGGAGPGTLPRAGDDPRPPIGLWTALAGAALAGLGLLARRRARA